LVVHEYAQLFKPPTGDVLVQLLHAKCPVCGHEELPASLLEENIRRRRARAPAYGPYLMGEDIFSFRRKYGLTQLAAARIFGRGKIAFSRYETEASFPDGSLTKLLKMAMRHPQVLKDLADEVGEPVPLWDERCQDATE
jgi:HTH-type transcriptional regulator/antitoxin MqsA